MSSDIITRCLKTRIGSKIPMELQKELVKLCEANPSYSSIVSKGNFSIQNKNCTVAGRKRKYVCFVKGDRNIPITKNKLFSKPKKECLHCGSNSCKRKLVIKTFRDSISDQISKYKKDFKKELTHYSSIGDKEKLNSLMRCPLTNTPLQLCPGGTHVDHTIPFSKLLEDFLKINKLDLCSIKLKGRGNNKEFQNFKLDEAWKEYHHTNAELQLVCKKANLKKSNRY